MIRRATMEDTPQINIIYNQNITNDSVSNCHLTKMNESYWAEIVSNPETIFAVTERENGRLTGWGCLKPFSIRENYHGIFELSIYVHEQFQNNTVAYFIYRYLMMEAKKSNYRQIAALVFENNIRSTRMLYRGGFKKVMVLPEVAIKNGKLISLVLLSKKLEMG
jgi:L-amino acid N-acyltransferase YncA